MFCIKMKPCGNGDFQFSPEDPVRFFDFRSGMARIALSLGIPPRKGETGETAGGAP
jgi:hypothetical protein